MRILPVLAIISAVAISGRSASADSCMVLTDAPDKQETVFRARLVSVLPMLNGEPKGRPPRSTSTQVGLEVLTVYKGSAHETISAEVSSPSRSEAEDLGRWLRENIGNEFVIPTYLGSSDEELHVLNWCSFHNIEEAERADVRRVLIAYGGGNISPGSGYLINRQREVELTTTNLAAAITAVATTLVALTATAFLTTWLRRRTKQGRRSRS